MKIERLITWLVFVVAMSIIGVLHACCNVTPLRMAQHGQCWSERAMVYTQCAETK